MHTYALMRHSKEFSAVTHQILARDAAAKTILRVEARCYTEFHYSQNQQLTCAVSIWRKTSHSNFVRNIFIISEAHNAVPHLNLQFSCNENQRAILSLQTFAISQHHSQPIR